MNNYIDNLLLHKFKIYKEKKKEKRIEKNNTEQYLDSYIAFIYNKQNTNNTSFLKEIKKFVSIEAEQPKTNVRVLKYFLNLIMMIKI